MTITERKTEVAKRLRKRDKKSLHDLAEEIGHGTTIKHLTLPIAQLVGDGEAVKHAGKPPTYSRA